MTELEHSGKPTNHLFYIKALKGFHTPPKEDLYASMLSIESEFNILKSRYVETEDMHINRAAKATWREDQSP